MGGGQLRAHGHRIAAGPGGHIHVSVLEGGHPGDADAGGGHDVALGNGQLTQDHEPVAGQQQVGGGGAAAEAFYIRGLKILHRMKPPNRLGRQFGVGMGQGAGIRVYGIVPGSDLIVLENDSPGLGPDIGEFPQHPIDVLVGDRSVGEESRYIIDVHRRHFVFSLNSFRARPGTGTASVNGNRSGKKPSRAAGWGRPH